MAQLPDDIIGPRGSICHHTLARWILEHVLDNGNDVMKVVGKGINCCYVWDRDGDGAWVRCVDATSLFERIRQRVEAALSEEGSAVATTIWNRLGNLRGSRPVGAAIAKLCEKRDRPKTVGNKLICANGVLDVLTGQFATKCERDDFMFDCFRTSFEYVPDLHWKFLSGTHEETNFDHTSRQEAYERFVALMEKYKVPKDKKFAPLYYEASSSKHNHYMNVCVMGELAIEIGDMKKLARAYLTWKNFQKPKNQDLAPLDLSRPQHFPMRSEHVNEYGLWGTPVYYNILLWRGLELDIRSLCERFQQ